MIINYLARIVDIKGIFELLECARRLKPKYPKLDIRIYGNFESEQYRKPLQDAVDKGFVTYCGHTNDVLSCIKICHGVIHPSYYEGMTNVVLEHSAVGRPCLGSDIPGVREGIEDGITGFLFPPKDCNALTKTVERFLQLSHDEREVMGKYAHEKMVNEFDRQIVVEKYMEEIKSIC